MHQNKLVVKSFFKSSPSLVNFIIKSMENNKILTVKEIKESIYKEFKLDISTQLIYNKLKKNGYVYKKFKINNNPYKLEEQVKQFEKSLTQDKFEQFNKLSFPAPPGSADYITYTLTSQKATTQYNDISQSQIPNKLDKVVKAWNELKNSAK
jgi:hypothetical protein